MLERMIGEGKLPNNDSFAIVLMPLVNSRQWDEAEEVLEIMRSIGFRTEKGYVSRLVSRVEARR